MTLRRKFTQEESCWLSLFAARVGDEVDAVLGDLMTALAWGDDSVLPEIHDRCNVLGMHDRADLIRKIIGPDDLDKDNPDSPGDGPA